MNVQIDKLNIFVHDIPSGGVAMCAMSNDGVFYAFGYGKNAEEAKKDLHNCIENYHFPNMITNGPMC